MANFDDILYTNPPSVPLIEGADVAFDVEWETVEAGGIGAGSASATVYELPGGDDVTATVMPSGSHVISGNVISYKRFQDFTPGKTYLAVWGAEIYGNQERRKTLIPTFHAARK